jgi:hypothetical protein
MDVPFCPLVPAKAGTQRQRVWIPACAGMSGGEDVPLAPDHNTP